MKKTALALAVVALSAIASQATTYRDVQHRNAYADEGKRSITGAFDLKNPGSTTCKIDGYHSGNGTFDDFGGCDSRSNLKSVIASFYVHDGGNRCEKIDIDFSDFGRPDFGCEKSVSFGDCKALITCFDNRGSLCYRIDSEKGECKLECAILTACSHDKVPDSGSAVLLLGFSVLGLFGISRKVASVA